jgi:hypothetical protein
LPLRDTAMQHYDPHKFSKHAGAQQMQCTPGGPSFASYGYPQGELEDTRRPHHDSAKPHNRAPRVLGSALSLTAGLELLRSGRSLHRVGISSVRPSMNSATMRFAALSFSTVGISLR